MPRNRPCERPSERFRRQIVRYGISAEDAAAKAALAAVKAHPSWAEMQAYIGEVAQEEVSRTLHFRRYALGDGVATAYGEDKAPKRVALHEFSRDAIQTI